MNLTAKEIIDIIEACSKANVASIKISAKGTEVVFISPQNEIPTAPSTQNQGNVVIPDPPAPTEVPDEKNLVKHLSTGISKDDEETELLIEELHLKDPSAYEDLVALKEITNVES